MKVYSKQRARMNKNRVAKVPEVADPDRYLKEEMDEVKKKALPKSAPTPSPLDESASRKPASKKNDVKEAKVDIGISTPEGDEDIGKKLQVGKVPESQMYKAGPRRSVVPQKIKYAETPEVYKESAREILGQIRESIRGETYKILKGSKSKKMIKKGK